MSEAPQRLSVVMPPFPFCDRLIGKTRKNFEIVISRYDEDIQWSDNYKEFRTVYNKGEHADYSYIKLDNKGHLADTILQHIINNYDNLADVTFFTHGSFNYRKDQIIKVDGPCHKKWDEFIQFDPNTLVCIEKKGVNGNTSYYNYKETVDSAYQKIFGGKYNVPLWGIGKIISVSRENIHNSPISIYKNMLKFVLEPFDGKEPNQHIYRTRGIYIERLMVEAFRKK